MLQAHHPPPAFVRFRPQSVALPAAAPPSAKHTASAPGTPPASCLRAVPATVRGFARGSGFGWPGPQSPPCCRACEAPRECFSGNHGPDSPRLFRRSWLTCTVFGSLRPQSLMVQTLGQFVRTRVGTNSARSAQSAAFLTSWRSARAVEAQPSSAASWLRLSSVASWLRSSSWSSARSPSRTSLVY